MQPPFLLDFFRQLHYLIISIVSMKYCDLAIKFSFVYPTEITACSDSFQEFEKMSKRFLGLQIQKKNPGKLDSIKYLLRRLCIIDKQRII